MESKPGTNPPPNPYHLPKKHPIGNKLGWILSGALVLALGVFIAIMSSTRGCEEKAKTTLTITAPG